jgi:hypothetical protein
MSLPFADESDVSFVRAALSTSVSRRSRRPANPFESTTAMLPALGSKASTRSIAGASSTVQTVESSFGYR